MAWVYLALAVVVLGANDYFVYKYGQKVVMKAIEEEHNLIAFAKNERAKVASIISSVKAKFHL